MWEFVNDITISSKYLVIFISLGYFFLLLFSKYISSGFIPANVEKYVPPPNLGLHSISFGKP